MDLTKYKKVFFWMFLDVLLIFLFLLYLRSQNPLVLPGVEKNFLITLFTLGLLLVVISLPERFTTLTSRKIRRWMSVRTAGRAHPSEPAFIIKAETREQLTAIILNAVFQVLLITFLLALLLNEFYPKIVSQWVDLTYFVVIVIIFGAASIWLTPKTPEPKQQEKLGVGGYLLVIAAGIAGTAIIWFKIQDLGWLAYLIAVTGGLLIILLSVLLLEGEENETGFTKNR